VDESVGKGGREHAIEIKKGKKVLKSNNDNGEWQRRKGGKEMD